MATVTTIFTTFNGILVHEAKGGVETNYISDPLSSLIECRDSTGTKTYEAEYWPYGEVQTLFGTNPSAWGFVGLLGYLTDSASLVYVRARYLVTALARWLTVDRLWPAEKAYSYVKAKPTCFVDPTGLKNHDQLSLSVCPEFKGTVIVIGEPPGSDVQGWLIVPPGYYTNPGMDVDYIVVIDEFGNIRYYFAMGTEPWWDDGRDLPQYGYIDCNGHLNTPGPDGFVGILSWGDYWYCKNWYGALDRPLPDDLLIRGHNPGPGIGGGYDNFNQGVDREIEIILKEGAYPGADHWWDK